MKYKGFTQCGRKWSEFLCDLMFFGLDGDLYLWYVQIWVWFRVFGLLALGLSTKWLGAQSPIPSTLSKKQWGVGVNVRHFGFDAGVTLQHPLNRKKTLQSDGLLPNDGVGEAMESLGAEKKCAVLSGLSHIKTTGFWLGPMKDPREVKVVNEALPGSRAFVIEKVSHNMSFRYQVGKSVSLGERNSRSNVGIRLNTSLQLPLNYSWPLYVWMYKPAPFTDGYTAVAYDPSIHDVGLVGGNAGYWLGFSDGKLTPGLGASVGIQAEWGSYRNVSNSLSMGISADRFVGALPFWHRAEMNRNFFPSVFVTFVVGFESNTFK